MSDITNVPPFPLKKLEYFPKVEATASLSTDFRRVLWTGEQSQLVIMNVPVNGEIGEETHAVDQHLVFLHGIAKAIVAGEEKEVGPGDLVIVPAGTKHNFINVGSEPLILYTIYAPAEHAVGAVHKTKEEGDRLEDEGKDEPPMWATK
ncbi:hypothetical protein M422DRAFT_66223 [Sphaerobolus stellatus SS14]|nr:hypothetical protein M422DRAFT_66223 [Sphaerobolus stellatus SS14]